MFAHCLRYKCEIRMRMSTAFPATVRHNYEKNKRKSLTQNKTLNPKITYLRQQLTSLVSLRYFLAGMIATHLYQPSASCQFPALPSAPAHVNRRSDTGTEDRTSAWRESLDSPRSTTRQRQTKKSRDDNNKTLELPVITTETVPLYRDKKENQTKNTRGQKRK